MAYPDDGDPVAHRILETLKTNMGAIHRVGPPKFHHTVDRAHIYEGKQITSGTEKCLIVIVPGADDTSGFTSCIKNEHLWQVAIIGALKHIGSTGEWKKSGRKLLNDMVVALALDMQLGGDAVYAEPKSEDLYDAGADSVVVCQLLITVNYRHLFNNPSLTA